MSLRPTSEILTIGDELLKGSILNTNAQFLSEQLARLGFKTIAQQACPDQVHLIQEALKAALARADVIILTGGLGPTPDDLTRESLAAFFHVPLKFSARQFNQILKYFKKSGRTVPKEWRREAEFPANAVQLINRYGVALGFYIKAGKKMIVVLPGVPREMRKMFLNLVEPLLLKSFPQIKKKYNLTVKFVGLGETQVMNKLGTGFLDGSFEFGIYPALGEVTMRLQSDKKTVISRLKKRIETKLKPYIYAYEETSLSKVIGELLLKNKSTLALAESCTGGGLGAELTANAGSSAYFNGGVIVYTNELKELLLGVNAEALKRSGAVSAIVAEQLAAGTRKQLKSDYSLAITGVAGPSGGTRKKPVGTVFIGLGTTKKITSHEFIFSGDRSQIQRKSIVKAMELLWRALSKKKNE